MPSGKSKKPRFWFWIWGAVVFLVLALMAPLLFPTFQGISLDHQKAAEYGEFVGGYAGPLAALLSFLILALALKAQRESSRLESFERQFFEKVRLHRANVDEAWKEKGEYQGRRVFADLVEKFRKARDIVDRLLDELNLSLRQQLGLAYYLVFFGVTRGDSQRMLSARLESDLRVELAKLWPSLEECDLTDFDSNQLWLGHYYRHLYQAVEYVDKQTWLTHDQKYAYVKVLRAQLSTHEQALLAVNSLTPIGANWWLSKGEAKWEEPSATKRSCKNDDRSIVKYRLVKNLPAGFFSEQEVNIDAAFPFNDYFERAPAELTKKYYAPDPKAQEAKV